MLRYSENTIEKLVTLLGMVILVRLVPLKELSLILITLSGIIKAPCFCLRTLNYFCFIFIV